MKLTISLIVQLILVICREADNKEQAAGGAAIAAAERCLEVRKSLRHKQRCGPVVLRPLRRAVGAGGAATLRREGAAGAAVLADGQAAGLHGRRRRAGRVRLRGARGRAQNSGGTTVLLRHRGITYHSE